MIFLSVCLSDSGTQDNIRTEEIFFYFRKVCILKQRTDKIFGFLESELPARKTEKIIESLYRELSNCCS